MKTKKAKTKSFYCTNLRIDTKLAEKVKAAAEASKRSMNKEIEMILEERFN